MNTPINIVPTLQWKVSTLKHWYAGILECYHGSLQSHDITINSISRLTTKKYQSSASLPFVCVCTIIGTNIPWQRASNAESVSMAWRLHVNFDYTVWYERIWTKYTRERPGGQHLVDLFVIFCVPLLITTTYYGTMRWPGCGRQSSNDLDIGPGSPIFHSNVPHFLAQYEFFSWDSS